MPNETSGDGLCSSCVDSSLPETYPQWRVELAYISLTIHIFVCLMSICMLIIQYSRADLRGRDPVLMWIIILGMLTCLFAPIRDIVSESRTSCVAQVIFAAFAIWFLLDVHLVRLARVLALHRQQQRAALALASRDSRSSIRIPSFQTVRLPSTAPASTAVNEIAINAPASPSCAAENDRRWSFSEPGLSPKSTSINTDISVAECGTPVSETRETDASCGWVLGWVLDKCKLHTTRGQLWCMVALATPKLITVIYRVTAPDEFRWDGYGCSDSYTDVQLLTVYVSVLAVLQLGGVIILYRRPDAFYLREELILVLAALILQFLLILNQKSLVGEKHVNLHFAMWTSWVFAAIVFVLPVCRKAPHLYEDESSRGKSKCCNGGRVRVHPNDRPAEHAITINIHTTNTTNVSTDGGECPQLQPSATCTAQGGGVEMLGTLLRYYAEVFSTKTDDFVAPSLNEILWDVEQTLQRDVHLLSLQDLEKICLFLAYQKDGRKLLSDCLAREWCMELLLFCVDVAEFHRQIERMEITFERLSLQLSRLKNNHDANTGTDMGTTRIRNASIVFGAPQKLYANVLNSARRIFRNYLDSSASTPVNLSPAQIQAATSSLASFEQTAVSMQRLLLGGLANLLSISDAALSFVTLDLPAFSHTFDVMERQVISDLATGPILRFTSSHTYATWKTAVIEEFRTTLQVKPAGNGTHRKRSWGKDNTFSIAPSFKPRDVEAVHN
jgi:hypothetical protein